MDVAAKGAEAAHVAVADAYAGHIGDGIERAGLQLAEADIEVAGTWFHGCSHLQFKYSQTGTGPCGSGLARDSDAPVTVPVGSAGPIAGKPAPTGIAVWLLAVFDLAPYPRAYALGRRRQGLQGKQRGHGLGRGVDRRVVARRFGHQRRRGAVAVGVIQKITDRG